MTERFGVSPRCLPAYVALVGVIAAIALVARMSTLVSRSQSTEPVVVPPMPRSSYHARLAAGARPRLSGLGQAIAGFGTFFLGIGFLQQGFAEVTVPAYIIALGHSPWLGIAAFLLIGMTLTTLTQSSSAAIAIGTCQ